MPIDRGRAWFDDFAAADPARALAALSLLTESNREEQPARAGVDVGGRAGPRSTYGSGRVSLVSCPAKNLAFRAPQLVQDKAPSAGHGRSMSKRGNTGLGQLRGSQLIEFKWWAGQ